MFSLFRRNSEVWKKYFIILASKCAGLFSMICFLIIILLSMLFMATYIYKLIDTVQIIYIDCDKPALYELNDKYISIGLDDIVISENFKGFNMTDKKLIKMIQYLHPAYLRIGGNLADKVLFSEENTDFKTDFYNNCDNLNSCDYVNGPNITLTSTDWLKLYNLAKQANVDIIFDLNSLIRFDNGTWNYKNAEQMIRFSNEHGLDVNWELGNEPNSYRHKFNEEVNATQLSKDFKTLRNILNKYEFYKKSILVGPDVTRLRDKETIQFFDDFLAGGVNELNAITWHHYYLNGHNCTADDFLNPSIFDNLINYTSSVMSSLQKFDIKKPVWLGETASAFGSGAPSLSDRFIGTFIYLDKLGLSAKLGINLIVRQSIWHGNYALLDENYNPNPDWWISLLHKRILSNNVVPSYTATSAKVRLYTQCTSNEVFNTFHETYPSVTVFGMNLSNSTSYVRIEGIQSYLLKEIFSFVITSDDLLSKEVKVNGQILKLDANYNLPKIVPKIVDARNPLHMPPYSLVYWIIPNVEVDACM